MVNFLIVLSILVLFHELGHYVAARYFNVEVESFSIGLGPRLVGFRRNGTDFKICLFPLGGYVKMAGQAVTGEPTGEPGELLSKPRWQRLIIVGMGPVFNFLLAIGLLAGLYVFQYERPQFLEESPRIGYVNRGSAAEAGGMLPGDVVMELDGVPTETWKDLYMASALASGRTSDVVVRRDGASRTLRIAVPEAVAADDGFNAGWAPAHTVVLVDVLEGSPAAAAGVEPGDRLVSIDGVEILAAQQMIDMVTASSGTEMAFQVDRAGRMESLRMSAERDSGEGAWRVGVRLQSDYERVSDPLSFRQALAQSTSDNLDFAGLIFRTLGALVVGDLSVKALEGPVGIYRHTQDAAERGVGGLVQFMAIISVNLGILNLLPIPVLDGGHILLLLVESGLRRDVSVAAKNRITQVGLVFIMVLFAIVMYNDLARQFFSP